MQICWLFLTTVDCNDGHPDIIPVESFVCNSRYFHFPENFAIQEASSCIIKFATALLFWISGRQSSNLPRKLSPNLHGCTSGNCNYCTQDKYITSSRHCITGLRIGSTSGAEFATNVVFSKIVNSTIGHHRSYLLPKLNFSTLFGCTFVKSIGLECINLSVCKSGKIQNN